MVCEKCISERTSVTDTNVLDFFFLNIVPASFCHSDDLMIVERAINLFTSSFFFILHCISTNLSLPGKKKVNPCLQNNHNSDIEQHSYNLGFLVLFFWFMWVNKVITSFFLVACFVCFFFLVFPFTQVKDINIWTLTFSLILGEDRKWFTQNSRGWFLFWSTILALLTSLFRKDNFFFHYASSVIPVFTVHDLLNSTQTILQGTLVLLSQQMSDSRM